MSKREEMRLRRQKEARRRQLIIAGAVGLVAIVVAGWYIAQSVIANSQPLGDIVIVPTQTWPQADGTALGPKTAKVLVQEFADFRCPVCREYFSNIEPQLIKDYVTTGKIRYEFHNFIVIDQNLGGAESRRAAVASLCANDQSHFWDFHNMLYNNQAKVEGPGAFTDKRLKAFAVDLGLDANQFNQCFDAQKYGSAVDADQVLGSGMGVAGTPTVFINGAQMDINVTLNYTALKAQIDLIVGK